MEELCDQTVQGSEDKQNRQFSVISENSMKQNNPLHCHVLEKIRRDVLRKCHFLFSGNSTGSLPSAGHSIGSLKYEDRTYEIGNDMRDRGDEKMSDLLNSLQYIHLERKHSS